MQFAGLTLSDLEALCVLLAMRALTKQWGWSEEWAVRELAAAVKRGRGRPTREVVK